MVVYADILIILNTIVDYFLLLLTSKLIRAAPTLLRQISAAILGGFSSLLIFLPRLSFILQLSVYILSAFLITAICFDIKNKKHFFRATVVFFTVSFCYAGLMFAVWSLFRPNGMIIHNSVVYFNISPIFLIVFSVISYFAVSFLRFLLNKNAALAPKCEIKLFANNRSVTINAISDTGNSIEDIFGLSEIIITEQAAVYALFGEDKNSIELKKRYRAVPCTTVSGSELLDGYRCDSAQITYDGKIKNLNKPILAVSKTTLGGDYSAVINPKILY